MRLSIDGNTSSINGRSMPENAFEFYDTVLRWVKEYSNTLNVPLILEMKFQYFNSSSSRYIFEILNVLERSRFKENYRIIWISERNDDLMIEKGEELKSLSDLVFEVVYA